MGEIAPSIAHELNQPLTAAANLAGAVSLTLKKKTFDGKEDALALIDDAVSEIRRSSVSASSRGSHSSSEAIGWGHGPMGPNHMWSERMPGWGHGNMGPGQQ